MEHNLGSVYTKNRFITAPGDTETGGRNKLLFEKALVRKKIDANCLRYNGHALLYYISLMASNESRGQAYDFGIYNYNASVSIGRLERFSKQKKTFFCVFQTH
jgi:hypothetical protein